MSAENLNLIDEYKDPSHGADGNPVTKWSGKFLRVGEQLFIDHRPKPAHQAIAMKLGLESKIEEISKSDPSAVDGGSFEIDAQENMTVMLWGFSTWLNGLIGINNITNESRQKTVELWQQKNPDFKVTAANR